MRTLKKRVKKGLEERARRRLLELRRSIAIGYWREREASRMPFEEVENLFELAAHSRDSEVVISLSEIERAQLLRIEEALLRIEAGTYGICTECGGDIAPARLEAVPCAPLCIVCQGVSEETEPLRAA